MDLSDRQEIYKNYLVDRLGFIKDTFLSKYLKKLYFSAISFRYLGALPIEYTVDSNEIIEKDGYIIKHELYVPKKFSIIDFLDKEFKTKISFDFTLRPLSVLISASDIANFTFCPVSYSISKTFFINKIDSAIIGSVFHEEKILLKYYNEMNWLNVANNDISKDSEYLFINNFNKFFFDDINSSRIIYSGHDNNTERKYFINSKGGYSGQPDYIFQNKDSEFFVVEEKFQFHNNLSVDFNPNLKFYSNHKNQLLSYLHGIHDYPLNYGYLVYWSYDMNYGIPTLHHCNVLKLIKSDDSKIHLNSIFLDIKKFQSSSTIDFDLQLRNPNKCANCVCGLLCGHKTGRYNTLSYPYSETFLRTFPAPFPKELKRYKTDSICQNSGIFQCSTHTNVEIIMEKGSVFPSCKNQDGEHSTSWKLKI